MRKVVTRDGSVTFYNAEVDDHYHSKSIGAFEEALEKYAKPACIQDGMTVLDVCFGLGYNTLAAMSLAQKLRIIALENDRNILEQIAHIAAPPGHDNNFSIIREAAKEHYYHDGTYTVKLLRGDANESLSHIRETVDAVLFDPFSPKKSPGLWEQGVFKKLYALMRPGARLATYSCAGWVRNNMRKAGFRLEDGPVWGRRSPATVAIR